KFNPELQRRHLELKEQRQKDFEEFVQQMKEHSKSDKSIWDAYKDSEKKRLREYEEKRRAELAAQAAQKEEIQRELASKS
ncbi:assembly factor cbp4, partial [Ascosphaera atra]